MMNWQIPIMGGMQGGNSPTTNQLAAYDLASEGKLVWELDGARNFRSYLRLLHQRTRICCVDRLEALMHWHAIHDLKFTNLSTTLQFA